MALQITHQHERNKVVLADAYHKIVRILIEKDRFVQFIVGIYPTNTEANDGTLHFDEKTYTLLRAQDQSMFDTYFSVSVLNEINKNPLERSYEYLKTLPEYSGAASV